MPAKPQVEDCGGAFTQRSVCSSRGSAAPTVRRAGPDDIPALERLVEKFVNESRYGWTFDAEVTRHTLAGVLSSPEAAVFVAVAAGGVVGFAIAAHERDFLRERLGYLVKFYVAPDYRGTWAGRLMANACGEWWRSVGCSDAFASATGNIGADKPFLNLFAKFGFSPCGVTIMRRFDE